MGLQQNQMTLLLVQEVVIPEAGLAAEAILEVALEIDAEVRLQKQKKKLLVAEAEVIPTVEAVPVIKYLFLHLILKEIKLQYFPTKESCKLFLFLKFMMNLRNQYTLQHFFLAKFLTNFYLVRNQQAQTF